jgi:hypothetical protein
VEDFLVQILIHTVITDGHQPREVTRVKILASGLWMIELETKDHLDCRLV